MDSKHHKTSERMTRKRTLFLAVAALGLAVLCAPSALGQPSGWRIAPSLQAYELVALPELTLHNGQPQVFSHFAARQQDGWRYLNARSGELFPQTALSEMPGTRQGMIDEWKLGCSASALPPVLQGLTLYNAGSIQPMQFPPTLLGEELFRIEPQMTAFKTDPQLLFADEPKPHFVGIASRPSEWVLDEQAEIFQMPEAFPWDGFVLMDSNGTRINEMVYEDYLDFQEGVAAVKLGGKWGYIDVNGVQITSFCYEPLTYSSTDATAPTVPYCAVDGLIAVKCNGLCGVIDTDGNEVLPCRYEGITLPFGGTVWVQQNGVWGQLFLPMA